MTNAFLPLPTSAGFSAQRLFTVNHTATPAGGAEVAAYDPTLRLAFIMGPNGVDIVTAVARPSKPAGTILSSIDVTPFGGNANSIAFKDGLLAIALAGPDKTQPGTVLTFRIGGEVDPTVGFRPTITPVATYTVGANPDQITFTPDGTKLLVANEGEPNGYRPGDVDPEGSVSIIELASGTVRTADFTAFNDQIDALRAAGVRIFGPGATVAQDLEPEYITVSADGKTAFVSLQENNAIAVLDIEQATFVSILPLGLKDHSLPGNGLDASDRDGPGNGPAINIRPWPVFGMYQPDGIATFTFNGVEYIASANEGDARDWRGFNEEVRVGAASYVLDPAAFPNASVLKQAANLGRLTVSNATGDTNGDGRFDQIHVFGARSLSFWTTDGTLVWDSKDAIERAIALLDPDWTPPTAAQIGTKDGLGDDSRSDNKGPEPEHVTIATIGTATYAFVGLERSNAVAVFRIGDADGDGLPDATMQGVIATPGHRAPEVFVTVPVSSSTGGQPLLIVPSEVSNTSAVYALSQNFTLQVLHSSDHEAGLNAVSRMPLWASLHARFKQDYVNTIVLTPGDLWIPGPFYAAEADPSLELPLEHFYTQLLGTPVNLPSGAQTSGRVTMAAMNAVGVTAASFGNHEFDLGTNPIAGIIRPSGQYPGALFPYLSANLDFSADTGAIGGNLAAAVTADGQEASSIKGRIAGTAVVTVGGEKIGLVGATTQILASISSPGAVRVIGPQQNDMEALAAILQPKIDALAAQGINKIVLMSHLQQYAFELDLATRLKGVDIVLAAGSHALFADADDVLRSGDVPAEGYPVLRFNADGDPVLIVSTPNEYAYVGRLVVEFDAEGRIVTDRLADYVSVNGAWATTPERVAEAWGVAPEALFTSEAFAPGSTGQRVKELADAVGAVINAQDGTWFGFTDVFLSGRRIEVRRQETNLGNLTADANLAEAKKTDPTVLVSIKNGGGIRDSIGAVVGTPIAQEVPPLANPDAGKPAGAVSQLDIVNSLRFNNALTLLTLTADGLKRILEHGVSTLTASNTPGQFPQVSGVNFSFDLTKPSGSRIQNAVIVNEAGDIVDVLVRDGALVGDAGREIRIVTLNFLANGGDGYPFGTLGKDRVDLVSLGQRSGAATFADDGTEQDALAEFLAARHATPETAYSAPNTPVELDTRIQQTVFRLDTVEPALEFGLYRNATFRGEAETLRNPMTNLVYTAEKVAGTFNSNAPDDPTGTSLARFRAGDGDITVSRIDFDGTGSLGSNAKPAMTIDWQGRKATVAAETRGQIAAIDITDFTGDVLRVLDFVRVDIDLRDADPRPDLARVVQIDGASRGSVFTGDAADVVTIGVAAANQAARATFRVETGAGDDRVVFGAAGTFSFGKGPASSDRFLNASVDLGAGNDEFIIAGGRASVRGGEGDDVIRVTENAIVTALYDGPRAGYEIVRTGAGEYRITDIDPSNGNEGTDLLFGVRQVKFADQVVALNDLLFPI